MRVRRKIWDVFDPGCYYYPMIIILMDRRNREQVAVDVPKGVSLFCYLSPHSQAGCLLLYSLVKWERAQVLIMTRQKYVCVLIIKQLPHWENSEMMNRGLIVHIA